MKLGIKKRETVGRKVKALRKEGLVPAEVFGRNFENIHVSVPEKEFVKLYKEAGQNTIIDLDIDGEKKDIPALIYDVQIHPISMKPMSVDFYRIREDEKIQTSVPIEYIGTSPMEKEEDFNIVKVLSEIEIESLPREIPHVIEVDMSQIETEDDVIQIGDLKFPEGVEPQLDDDAVVVSVTEKQEEEEEEVAPIMPGELGGFGEDMEEGEMPLGDEEGDILDETPSEEGQDSQENQS